MTTQPDRQDRYGLLKTARSRIAAMKIAPCSGIVSSRAAAEELERALDYLATPQPARDAAEGALLVPDDKTAERMTAARLQDTSAPPKPAPDAMRAEDQVQFGRRLHHKPFPLSAPVPPADGAGDQIKAAFYEGFVIGTVAIEPTDSVEAVWELSEAKVAAALSPSGTGAAEPVAGWQWRHREAHPGAPWTSWGHVQDVEAFRKLFKNQMVGDSTKAAVELRPVFAAPPVRGDREAIANIRYEHGHYSLRDVLLEGFQAMKFVQPEKAVDDMLDAILSLPVPPGAGERS